MLVFRAIGVLLAIKIPSQIMLFANYALMTVGGFVLLFFAKNGVNFLWAGFIIIGAGSASTLPSVLVFVQSKMKLTNTILGFIMFVSALSAWLLPIFIGSFIDKMPMILVYVSLALICGETIFFIGLYLYTRNIVKETVFD